MKFLNKYLKLNNIKYHLKVLLVVISAKMEIEDQRRIIFFLWKKDKSANEIHDELVCTEGEHTASICTIRRWIAKFKCGVTDFKKDAKGGCEVHARTDRNIERVRKLLEEDRRSSIRLLAELIKVSKGTISTILHEDLGLTRLCCRWVPRMLTAAMRTRRVEDSEYNVDFVAADEEIFCTRYSTMDEVWLYLYDPETKQQSSVWVEKGSKPPVKFKVGPSAKKVMAIIFWDAKGIIYIEYMVDGRTVTGARFANSVRKFKEEVLKKRRGKVRAGLVLHMDNAPAHTSHVAQAASRESGIELLPHPPYSPDLAPSDYWLFPNLKKTLKGRRFKDTSDVIEAAKTVV